MTTDCSPLRVMMSGLVVFTDADHVFGEVGTGVGVRDGVHDAAPEIHA